MNTREITPTPAAAATTMLPSVGGLTFTPSSLTEVLEFAKMMAQSGPNVPAHCRGNPGACLAVTMRALNWGMEPFAVASKSYQVKDQIVAYESQMIHAVVNTRAGLVDDLEVSYEGEGVERRCKVVGSLNRGKRLPREYVSPRLKDIKVKNSPLWVSDPDQQLHYFSTRNWARRWCPEVLLGVYTREEIESGGVTDADRAEAIEHRPSDALDDGAGDDPHRPAPTAPLAHRLSFGLEKCTSEGECQALMLKFQPEVDAVAEAGRKPLRELYKAHLRLHRGEAKRDEVMEFSEGFRKQAEAA